MPEIDLLAVDAKATEALRISQSNEAKLSNIDLQIAAIEAKNEKRHEETMGAIKASSGEVNNTAIVKLVAAGALLLTSLAGLGNALAPVLPDVFRARYSTPVVVTVTAAPVAVPAPSATVGGTP